MQSNTTFVVGNGFYSFLNCNWSGAGPLSEIFPHLLGSLLHSQLRDLFVDGQWRSNLLFFEVYDFVSPFLFHFLDSPDVLVWKLDLAAKFSISSTYNAIRVAHNVVPEMAWIWS